MGYVEETLEELGSSNLFAKRKRQKLEIGTDNSTLDGFDEASHDSSPDPEMSEDLNVTKCIICLRYSTFELPLLNVNPI